MSADKTEGPIKIEVELTSEVSNLLKSLGIKEDIKVEDLTVLSRLGALAKEFGSAATGSPAGLAGSNVVWCLGVAENVTEKEKK